MGRMLSWAGVAFLILGTFACAAGAEDKTKPYSNVFEDDGKVTALNVRMTSDKGYLVVGKKKVNGNHYDAFLAKFTEGGTKEWMKTYGTAENDEAIFATEKLDDGKIVGYIVFGNTSAVDGSPYSWARLVDEKGSIIKRTGRRDFDYLPYIAQRIYGVTHIPFDGVRGEHFLLAGVVKSKKRKANWAWLAKVDPSGDVLKEQQFGYEDKEELNMRGLFAARTSDRRVAMITNTWKTDGAAGAVDKVVIDETPEGFKANLIEAKSDTKDEAKNPFPLNTSAEPMIATAAIQARNKDIIVALSYTNSESKKSIKVIRISEKNEIVAESLPKINEGGRDRMINGLLESGNHTNEIVAIGMISDTRSVRGTYFRQEMEFGRKELPQFWVARFSKNLTLKWDRQFTVANEGEGVSGIGFGVAEDEDHYLYCVGISGKASWDHPRYPSGVVQNEQIKNMTYANDEQFKIVVSCPDGNCKAITK